MLPGVKVLPGLVSIAAQWFEVNTLGNTSKKGVTLQPKKGKKRVKVDVGAKRGN